MRTHQVELKQAVEEMARIFKAATRPDYMQLSLSVIRKWESPEPKGEAVKQFLELTKEIDGDAIVVVTREGLSLLTDDDGNLLAFGRKASV